MTTTIEKLAEEVAKDILHEDESTLHDEMVEKYSQAIQTAMLELIGAVPEQVNDGSIHFGAVERIVNGNVERRCLGCHSNGIYNQARQDLITKAKELGCDTTQLLNPKT